MKTTQTQLTCPCGASAKDTSKERGRFARRHPPALNPEHIEEQKRMRTAAEAKAAAQKGA